LDSTLIDDLANSLQAFRKKPRALDFGEHTFQVLKKQKLFHYKDLRLPLELPNSKKLILRTGECSG